MNPSPFNRSHINHPDLCCIVVSFREDTSASEHSRSRSSRRNKTAPPPPSKHSPRHYESYSTNVDSSPRHSSYAFDHESHSRAPPPSAFAGDGTPRNTSAREHTERSGKGRKDSRKSRSTRGTPNGDLQAEFNRLRQEHSSYFDGETPFAPPESASGRRNKKQPDYQSEDRNITPRSASSKHSSAYTEPIYRPEEPNNTPRSASSKHSNVGMYRDSDMASVPESAAYESSKSKSSSPRDKGRTRNTAPTPSREADRVSDLRNNDRIVTAKFPTPTHSTGKSSTSGYTDSLTSSHKRGPRVTSRPHSGPTPSEVSHASSLDKRSYQSTRSGNSATMSIPRHLAELDMSLPTPSLQEKLERKHDEPPPGSGSSNAPSVSLSDGMKKREDSASNLYAGDAFRADLKSRNSGRSGPDAPPGSKAESSSVVPLRVGSPADDTGLGSRPSVTNPKANTSEMPSTIAYQVSADVSALILRVTLWTLLLWFGVDAPGFFQSAARTYAAFVGPPRAGR